MNSNPLRPVPSDFLEFAPGKSTKQLKEYYKVSVRVIVRWRKETGVPGAAMSPPPLRHRPLPDDFEEQCLRKTKGQLILHYKTNRDVVTRWLTETGFEPRIYSGVGQISKMGRYKPCQVVQFHTKSMMDEAADILRRERWIVFRCNRKGEYAQAGEWWRVGNVICTTDELMQRADRYRSKAA